MEQTIIPEDFTKAFCSASGIRVNRGSYDEIIKRMWAEYVRDHGARRYNVYKNFIDVKLYAE